MKDILCSKCNIIKKNSEFNKSSCTKSGFQYKCKECEKEYRELNKERYRIQHQEYNQNNKEKIKIQKRQYFLKNKEKINKRRKTWEQKNKEHIKQQKKEYRSKNKEKERARVKKYREQNIEAYRKYQREYTKNKRRTDPHYAIQHRLRNRLSMAFRRGKGQKSVSFIELIGCSFKELEKHIESQFTENMSWEAFFEGKIVIDHIKPCCSFDLEDTEQQKQCFHYSNLRPLWKEDNEKKISEDLKLRLI